MLCGDRHRQGRGGCLRADPGGEGRGRRKQTRTFSSFTGSLEAMADWFTAEGVTEVAMEATGSYWKPVWYVLEARGSRCSWSTPTTSRSCPAARPTC